MLALFFSFLACSPTPEKTITQKQYSLTCPKGWKLTDDSETDFSFFTCEKSGWDTSGQVMLLFMSQQLELDTAITNFQSSFADEFFLKGLSYSERRSGSYGTFKSRSLSFDGNILTLPYEGSIHGFSGCGGTFLAVEMGAKEDRAANLPGFQAFASKLSCTTQ